MHRFLKSAGLTLAVLAVIGVSSAHAQVVQVYYPAPAVSPAPVVSYYAPPVYAAPTVTYYQPVTSYYQPVTSYYQPVTSYYAAPAPVAYAPGVVTTRSFVGLGIFRPRGVYTQSYYSPGYVSSYAPTVSYYYNPVYGYLR